MKILSLSYINPELIFAEVANNIGTIFLDSSMSHEYYGRYSYIVINPIKYYIAGNISEDLIYWQDIFKKNSMDYNNSLPPFIGGLVGYLSYDLITQIEPDIDISDDKIVPDYIFGLYNQVFAFDNIDKKLWLIVHDIKGYDISIEKQLDAMLEIYHNVIGNNLLLSNDDLLRISFLSNYNYNDYINNIKKAQDYIFSGDIFEVNITQKFSNNVNNIDCFNLYKKLRNINPAPFSSYINFDDLVIMSSSPERFMQIINREVEVRPIKGTIKRCEDEYLDKLQRDRLVNSEKDRAENIMIVDLMRNDLSIVCEAKSVLVKHLCQIESYTNLHHLVSVVIGKLKDQYSIFDAILKCFPAGSITGAPKIRAMEIIDELENFKRGIYCGCIGYFSFNQTVDFSVSIRTIVKNSNEISFYSGGAVTLDSNSEDEYQELMLKVNKIIQLFS